MPPRRPLPDVCLITVLKFLEPMNQLKASKMSPRFKPLVRAANRPVKTLVITDVSSAHPQDTINSFFISSMPNLHQMTDDSGKAIDFQPKTVCVNRWNFLGIWTTCQDDLPTVEEIATVLFSAVTTLVFIVSEDKEDSFDEHCQYLVSLLQHPHLATQLESLVLQIGHTFFFEPEASGTYELITALNSLSALQQLAVDFDFGLPDDGDLPALTVLAQLKVLVVKLGNGPVKTAFFLDAIANQAADNVDLQIHLKFSGPYCLAKYFAHWSIPLLSRVVSLEDSSKIKTVEKMPCRLFPSLTCLALSIYSSFSANYFPWITALSQHNRQLLHLDWCLDLEDQQNLDQNSTPPPRSLPQLTSVRAVTLSLDLYDHSQAESLHLPRTLPNCQAIHLRSFNCNRCEVNLCALLRGHYHTEDSKTTNSAALKCLRESLSKLYPYFQRHQIILGFEEPLRTAAEVFAEQ